jgi:hypothetical protein
MQEVYKYIDYRRYLADYYDEKKNINAIFPNSTKELL